MIKSWLTIVYKKVLVMKKIVVCFLLFSLMGVCAETQNNDEVVLDSSLQKETDEREKSFKDVTVIFKDSRYKGSDEALSINGATFTKCRLEGRPSLHHVKAFKHAIYERQGKVFLRLKCSDCDFNQSVLDFENADLECSSFIGCKFSGAQFVNFRLGFPKRVQLNYSYVNNNELKNCVIEDQNFHENNCRFVDVKISDCVFKNCVFPDRHRCHIECVDSQECELTNFNFCTIENTTFENCFYYKNDQKIKKPITASSFCGAKIKDVIFINDSKKESSEDEKIFDISYRKIIRNVDFKNEMGFSLQAFIRNLRGFRFENCKMSGRHIFGFDISGAVFTNCKYFDTSDGDKEKPFDEEFLKRERNELSWDSDNPPRIENN
jgi:uncharacterized protein YjbI with pentapeptide repeats